MTRSRTFGERARDFIAALLGPVTPEPTGEERGTYWAPQVPTIIGNSRTPYVTTSTADQSVAIRSTTDLIASLVSELPITVYTGKGRGDPNRRPMSTPQALEDPGGDETGREDWGYRLLMSWLKAGNAFGNVIDRDERGRLLAADLFHPDMMTCTVVDGRAKWYVNGREISAEQLRHWRVNPVAGQVLGLSPIQAHAVAIGTSLATSRFGLEWFTDDAHPGGMLTFPSDIDAEQAAIAKARFLASQGSKEPVVLGGGWKWDDIQVTPEESQFLETAGLSEAQCCRIYGPGWAELLGYGSKGSNVTYSNIVDRRQDVLVLSLNRWVRRYERVLSLFTPRPQWVEVNRDALLESTTLQRYQVHAAALNAGWKTVNEVRDLENLKPLPGGDDLPKTAGASPAPTTTEEAPSGDTAGS